MQISKLNTDLTDKVNVIMVKVWRLPNIKRVAQLRNESSASAYYRDMNHIWSVQSV